MNPVVTVHLRAWGAERGGDAWERPSPRGYMHYLNSLGIGIITE